MSLQCGRVQVSHVGFCSSEEEDGLHRHPPGAETVRLRGACRQEKGRKQRHYAVPPHHHYRHTQTLHHSPNVHAHVSVSLTPLQCHGPHRPESSPDSHTFTGGVNQLGGTPPQMTRRRFQQRGGGCGSAGQLSFLHSAGWEARNNESGDQKGRKRPLKRQMSKFHLTTVSKARALFLPH